MSYFPGYDFFVLKQSNVEFISWLLLKVNFKLCQSRSFLGRVFTFTAETAMNIARRRVRRRDDGGSGGAAAGGSAAGGADRVSELG